MPARFVFWVVDDSIANQQMVSRSLQPVAESVDFHAIGSGAELEESIRRAIEGRQSRPHFILMDFFMGDSTGVSLVEAVRRSDQELGHPVVIAHSSMKAASEAMVRAGADFLLPKTKGSLVSEPITTTFETHAQIEAVLRTRRP